MFGWLLSLHKCFGSGRANTPEPESQPAPEDVQLDPPSLDLGQPQALAGGAEHVEPAGSGDDKAAVIDVGRRPTSAEGGPFLLSR